MPMPQPPFDAVMPESEGMITVIWACFALASIAYCTWRAIRDRSALPLAIVIGTSLAMFAEALVIQDMHCWYPAVGQMTAWVANGQSIPVFVPFAYVFFFAPWILMLMDAFAKGMSRRQFWTAYIIAVFGVLGYEAVGMLSDSWMYYGYQPLTVGGFPLFWAVLNPTLIVIPAVILFRTRHLLKGWAALLAVTGFLAAQVTGLEFLLGYPYYAAINTSTSPAVMLLGLALSGILIAAALEICARLICLDARQTACKP